MNAQTAIEIALRGGVIPAIAALATFMAIGWLWPADAAHRYGMGVSFALGVFIGFVLLPTTITLAPMQFWEWLPHLGLLAAFVAGLTRAVGVRRGERWAAIYLFAAVAGWLLVPKWPELVPAWPIQWACLTVGLIILTAFVLPLAELLYGRAIPWWLMLAGAATSLLIMAEVSVTSGPMAALPAGALAGCGIAALFAKEPVDWRSLALPYAVVVGGFGYMGYVYPTTPLPAMLLLPLAPVVLWLCTIGPLRHLTGARAIAAQAICVLAPLLVVAAYFYATGGGGDEW